MSEEYIIRINEIEIKVNKEVYELVLPLGKIIEQLQQENQQLKNDNAVMKANLIQVSDKQRDLYKEVIEEVREYATNEMRIVNDNEYHKLLQILDKEKN